MKIKRENVYKDTTSCSFCDRGKLSVTRYSLVYPYQEVTTFMRSNGNGMKVSICDDCLKELNLFNEPPTKLID